MDGPQPNEDTMNLFVVDADPRLAAQCLYDLHVQKMILETAQILDGGIRPLMNHLEPRGNHEIVKIPRFQLDNAVIRSAIDPEVWDWAFQHYIGLLVEYRHRTGKVHSYAKRKYDMVLLERRQRVAGLMQRRGFRLAMPAQYRIGDRLSVPMGADLIGSYRDYYAHEKLTYGKRNLPSTWRVRSPAMWLYRDAGKLGMEVDFSDDGRWYFHEVKR